MTRPEPVATNPPRRRPRVAFARVTTGLALSLASLLALHVLVPGAAGLIVDSGLPLLGLALPVLLVCAVVTRSRAALGASAVAALIWGAMFVPGLLPLSGGGASGGEQLVVASQNVQAGSGTAADSAETLAATGADVIALQEMDSESRDAASVVLDALYPYSYGVGTVGVWSVYPIENAQMIDLGLGWKRGLAADLETPAGLVSLYVVHAASARPDSYEDRNVMLANLAEYFGRDENDRVIAMGDFNAGSSDRALGAITSELTEANQSGGGFGFTWPADAPVIRIDHLFQRGMDVVSNGTMRAGNSDHLAVVSTLKL
ncbi:MAG: endonuclease/exonuclease/phosphatase family protein [Rhodoglobus sp.]